MRGLFRRNPAAVPITNDVIKFWLGMQVQKFMGLYGDEIYRCVDVSAEFVKYITQHPASQFQLTVKLVRRIITTRGADKEHSWVEVSIGKSAYIVDITGIKQFDIDFPVWPRDCYIKNLSNIMSDARRRRMVHQNEINSR